MRETLNSSPPEWVSGLSAVRPESKPGQVRDLAEIAVGAEFRVFRFNRVSGEWFSNERVTILTEPQGQDLSGYWVRVRRLLGKSRKDYYSRLDEVPLTEWGVMPYVNKTNGSELWSTRCYLMKEDSKSSRQVRRDAIERYLEKLQKG